MKLPDDILKDISDKFSKLAASGPAEDIKTNVNALLQGALGKLDLVTKEEFDVQTKVLARTREKVDALEKVVAELEQRLDDQSQSNP